MIVSRQHRFIFIKTRKTAGTSIEIALSRFCGPDDIITPIEPADEQIRSELGYRPPQHYAIPLRRYTLRDWARLMVRRSRAAPFRNHQPAVRLRQYLPGPAWASYFKFCVGRNPWDKVLSCWHYHFGGKGVPTLGEFIRSDALSEFSDWPLYTDRGRIIVDYVAKYESLGEELEGIRNRIGIPEPLQIPRAKGQFRRDQRPYWEVLKPAERRRIEQVFSKEIDHFEYTFDPVLK